MLAKQHRLVEEVAQLQALVSAARVHRHLCCAWAPTCAQTQRLSAAESQLREQAWCGESAAACEQALGDQTERLMALTQTKQQLQVDAPRAAALRPPLTRSHALSRRTVSSGLCGGAGVGAGSAAAARGSRAGGRGGA